jgi:L-malate glycosyltransferase
LKIAYIYDAIYPWVKGGAEKRIYEISSRLAERGHEVHCYGMKWWPGDRDIITNGVHQHGICPSMPLYKNGKRSIIQATSFAGKVLGAGIDCDVVDCQNFPYISCFSAKLLCSLQGHELFITWHEVWGDYWYEYLGKIGFLGKTVERAAAHLTERNIAVSERTKRDLEGLGANVGWVLPNGIDAKRIERIAASPEESDILFVGRLVEHKNVDLLLDAIEILKVSVPDIRVVIIGDGPEAASLKHLSREKGLERNVEFHGFVDDYDDALALMKSSRIFASPSIREGFGMAALEANACGLPVVTVDHKMNAVSDLVTKETGVVCIPTPQALADAISRTLQESGGMRGQCMEEARKYDWKEICDKIESAYRVVC